MVLIGSSLAIVQLLDHLGWPKSPLHRSSWGVAFLSSWGVALGSIAVFWFATLSKVRARKACRILLLRSFYQESHASLYKKIFPVIGCYGRLVALRNPTQKAAADILGAMHSRFLTDVEEHLVARGDWHTEVTRFLRTCDLAVIDITASSDAIRWELSEALRLLPADRLILIIEYSKDAHSSLQSALRTYIDCECDNDFDFAMYFTSRAIPLRVWKAWPLKFERQIALRMKRIDSAASGTPTCSQ
ncbi:hypothetical protein [Paraburkholderia monticola]|uniref:hypothetical protein n=1 Tax=Paraburkholderia monticola TaxID=1399968 RepID=UPI000B2054F1|nr:hypothetical protein [Paraburkholderia monticola]